MSVDRFIITSWEQWQWRGTPHSPKLQHCWNLPIRLFSVISRTLVSGGGSYPSVEVQSVYSTAPADWAIFFYIENFNLKYTNLWQDPKQLNNLILIRFKTRIFTFICIFGKLHSKETRIIQRTTKCKYCTYFEFNCLPCFLNFLYFV